MQSRMFRCRDGIHLLLCICCIYVYSQQESSGTRPLTNDPTCRRELEPQPIHFLASWISQLYLDGIAAVIELKLSIMLYVATGW